MKKRDFLTIAIGSVIFAFILNSIFPQNENSFILSPLPEEVDDSASAKAISENESKELAAVVDSALENASGTYGIFIKNLRTGETYSRNADREFQPASLYKLWVAAYAFKQIDAGEIDRNDTYSQSIAELNRIFGIDEEEAEQTEGTITRTVEDAIEQMITISHNYSALLLSQELGNSNIASYMNELGLNDSRMGTPPITTPRDIAKFFELLYEGRIVNQRISSEFIDILSRQQLNDRIPKYLPDNVRVAHKTGELGLYKHDAGIVFASDTILFVALSETSSHPIAAETIASLSEDVYNYFEGN